MSSRLLKVEDEGCQILCVHLGERKQDEIESCVAVLA